MTEAAHKLSVQAAVSAMRDAEQMAASERTVQAIAEERAACQQHRCVIWGRTLVRSAAMCTPL